MSLSRLVALARELPGATDLVGARSVVLSVPESARPFALAGLAPLGGRRPVLVACATQADADRLAGDLIAFLGPGAVDSFPAWETLPFERVSPNVETMGRRLRAMWRLRHGDPVSAPGDVAPAGGRRADARNEDRGGATGNSGPAFVIAPIKALLQRLGPHVEDVTAEPVVVRPGDNIDPEELVRRLVAMGYRREHQVEHRGELAMRGSIVDVYPSTADVPVRIDLWGDEVDRLTEMSVADQRSVRDLEVAVAYGCREVLPTEEVADRAAGLLDEQPWGRSHWDRLASGLTFDGMESWLPWLVDRDHLFTDLLPPGSLVVLTDPQRMRTRAAEILDEEQALATALATTWNVPVDLDMPRLHLGFDRLLAKTDVPVWTLAAPGAPTSIAPVSGLAELYDTSPVAVSVDATGWNPVHGDPTLLVQRINSLKSEGYRIVVCADGQGSATRLAANLSVEGITAPTRESDDPALTAPGVSVVVEPLDRGFVLPGAKLAVLAEADLTGRRRAHRKARPRVRSTEGFFDSLKPGDYVVHHHHGVGKFTGLERRSLMGSPERDYLVLQYRDGSLNLPSDQIDLIRPYTGGETPSLNRMGGGDFARAKAKVRTAVREIAQELVVLYQKRISAPGHCFAPDTPWQTELEEGFGYTETVDQLSAINDVKQDMETGKPMDRLVCGDVGFGKTEIAIRAAMKAVQDGKQVAVLVPTTLLAAQHHQTFSDRFAGFPVRVEVLSRFLTTAQAKKVVAAIGDGEVDIVIGTHRLLMKGLRFRDLGLLVVDEEQRFGVTHKEQIKQLKANVDVLTLTATPIPRTLEMSLTGIRDLSILNTPPAERLPILTYVGEFDQRAVAESIRRELLREGQVFYVHNRVRDIEEKAIELRELVPEARICVAHGQMDEGSLEQAVYDFWEGKFDVLVCTTIIESGIDMPTVNTLVVERADLLGLGQLHQIRGRVGRAGQRAYAYLFHPADKVLSEEAYERLKTIGEHTELGSGFKIAMRDLEIRGAGNLLGGNQSGHIAAVGYDLYVQMVSEAVSELKGEPVAVRVDTTLELPIEANLPVTYVPRDDARLEAYRRLAGVLTHEEVDDIQREWQDRFGPLPGPASGLIAVGHLRAECERVGLREIVVGKGMPGSGPSAITVRMAPVELKTSQELRLARLHPKAVLKPDVNRPGMSQIVLPLQGKRMGDPAPSGVSLVEALIAFVRELMPL